MILTLGDSVAWGQGLLDEHKFDRIYAAGRPLARIAHSGAILGAAGDNSTQHEYPEVPVAFPSVWQQMHSVSNWPDVDLALVTHKDIGPCDRSGCDRRPDSAVLRRSDDGLVR